MGDFYQKSVWWGDEEQDRERVPFYLGWGKVPKQYHSETFYDVRFVRYLYKSVLVIFFWGGEVRGSRRYGL